MTLTLRIDNHDSLPDGGPTSVVVTQAGVQVGRSTAMDWTLPDPDRHISSHHFDVKFENGSYYLIDTSTNGLFMDGSRHRLAGPHALQPGERFQVGHYYITVSQDGVGAAPAAAPPAPAPSASFAADADPWAIGGAPATPINPNPTPQRNPFDDFAGEFLVNPTPSAAPPAPHPAPEPVASASPFGAPAAPAAAPSPLAVPPAAPPPGIGQPVPAFSPPPTPAPAPSPTTGLQHPPIGAAPAPAAGATDFIKAFCEGAGLPPEAATGVDPEAFARELGKGMRVTAQELMSMLQDRASAKQFTKGGERTMMGATENNPLKFLPDANQALEVMFLRPRDGFMNGSKGVETALSDVRLHQMAVFAAIQPALVGLLQDLAPEAIDADTGGGLLGGSGKRKAWDTYVERWDTKVSENENGMLGAFLKLFAESYVTAVESAKK